MKSIVLIGMPGAGKSTIGVLLAKALGLKFIDTDISIQNAEKRLLQNIIDKDGIEAFLQIEERVVLGIETEDTVIATGGSVVYSGKAMEKLKSSCIIIYLKIDFPETERRLNNIKTRGIVMENGKGLIDIYNERTPLYMQYADIALDCTGKSVEEVFDKILENL
ncbi:MAG TPA: shikimate kinase [Clostridia bacterium]